MWKKKKTKWPLRQVGILNRNMLSSALCCCWHFCIRPALNKHLQLMVMIGNWSCSVAWSEPQLLWRLDGLAAWVCCQTLQVCQPPHFLPGCSEQSLSSQWEAVHHSKIFSEEAVHHQSLSAGKLSTTQSFQQGSCHHQSLSSLWEAVHHSKCFSKKAVTTRASQQASCPPFRAFQQGSCPEPLSVELGSWASRMRLICLCQNSVVYSWQITMKTGSPNMNCSTELSEKKSWRKREKW